MQSPEGALLELVASVLLAGSVLVVVELTSVEVLSGAVEVLSGPELPLPPLPPLDPPPPLPPLPPLAPVEEPPVVAVPVVEVCMPFVGNAVLEVAFVEVPVVVVLPVVEPVGPVPVGTLCEPLPVAELSVDEPLGASSDEQATESINPPHTAHTP